MVKDCLNATEGGLIEVYITGAPFFSRGGLDTWDNIASLIVLLPISAEAIEVIAGKASHHNTDTF